MDYQDEINLINFFTRNRNLTLEQQRRFKHLLARDLEEINQKRTSSNSSVEDLLKVWEKEGLDAAVKEWKKTLLESSKKKLPKQKKKFNNIIPPNPSSDKLIIDPILSDEINPADFEAIKSEIEALKNTIKKENKDTCSSYDFLWNDITFLESGEP